MVCVGCSRAGCWEKVGHRTGESLPSGADRKVWTDKQVTVLKLCAWCYHVGERWEAVVMVMREGSSQHGDAGLTSPPSYFTKARLILYQYSLTGKDPDAGKD